MNFWSVLKSISTLSPVVVKQQNTAWIEGALDLIRQFEGYHDEQPDGSCVAYLCPAGVWTIGWGSTRIGGRAVRKGDRLTRSAADALFRQQVLNDYIAVLETTIPHWNEMRDGQKIALTSFAYNLGARFYGAKGFNTITKNLSSKSLWSYVPETLKLYRNPGTSAEKGLLRRRIAEGRVWLN